MPTVNIDHPELTTRRVALSNAREVLVNALFEFEDATKAFKEAKRLFAPGDDEYDQAKDRLDAARIALDGADGTGHTDGARKAEADAYASLNQGLATWLSDTPNERFLTVEEDVSRLNQNFPIVMLPIRIETRFDGPLLKVRIYPDEIFQNRMEYPLTSEERDAGEKYWNDFNKFGHEEDRWREIIQQFGPERSAHIVRFMRPTNFPTAPDPDFPCSEKLQGGQNVTLTFPTNVPLRAAAWTRPAEAILPDRWVLVTYRNGVRRVKVGFPIVEPLAMTTDPSVSESQLSQISSDQAYKIDDKLRWTVDFTRAKAVGMAIDLDLDANEAAIGTGGFDRLLVFGVKTSMETQFTTFTLAQLFDGHHHTRGLAFVRQGSPTNNTKGSPTQFPPDDEDGNRSFRIEREHPPTTAAFFNDCLPDDSDGAALAFSLGMPNAIFANVDRSMEHEILRGKAMNRVLWPLTFGYFMKVLMEPIFSEADIALAKGYAYNYVRPRGVAPAFRVGEVPYGVLPVTSIYRWQTSTTDPNSFEFGVTSKIIEPLKRLVAIWLDASADVPKVTGNATDPDVELMKILSTHPSTKEIRVRHGVGLVTWYNIFNLFGWSFTLVDLRMKALTEALFRRLGHPEWRPRIGNVIFDSRAWRLLFPLVSNNPLETKVDATSAFITGIRTATVQQLKDNTFSGVPANFSFLYSLLRHATLAEYGRITDEFLAAAKWKEPELYGFPSQPASPTIVQEALAQIAAAFDAAMAPHRAALDELALATDAELDRLLGETLDLASHRLDAWVTGVATQRLTSMRFDAESFGQYLGGYAWVENLRPVLRSTKTIQNVGTFEIQSGTGGFIHTPSMTHAAAAAILRSAHISHKREDPQKFAVDLSSRRVRNARRILDEIRAGQPLGAILGYRFERGLHEGHPGVPDLDKYRFALRNRFPLVAGKNGSDTTELAENIAARNVVDGVALIRAYRTGAYVLASDPNLPQTNQRDAVKFEIDKITELNDSVADLLMAESAYQLARGNLVGAPAPLTNANNGRPPPDPGVAHSARTGIGLAHRVALVFSADPVPDLPSWPAPSPRALAEPALDSWLGRIIGDPANVTCVVTFTEAPGSVTVKLSDLGLRPLDVLALARVAAEKGLGAMLDERVLTAALGSETTKTNVAIDYGPRANRNPKSDRTFPEVLEVARALGAALGGGRPLEIGDLISPTEVDRIVSDTDTETTAAQDAGDIKDRANDALTALEEVTNSTTVTAEKSLARAIQVANPTSPTSTEIQNLRAALTVAAKFAPERAFPPRTASGPELLSLAKAVRKEFTRRLKAANDQNLSSAVLAKDITARAIEVLKAIFGKDFVALPTLHVPRSDEIDESFDARADLIGQDDKELSAYFQQATRARANLRRFNKFSIYSHALGQAPLSLNVAQLPRVEGEQWLGRKLVGAVPPKEGRAAILFLSEEDVPDIDSTWRGVLLEQWTEVIPKTQEQTAVAMHFDTPRAAAPQSILVAVPSRMDVAWQFEDIVAILNETLDLAKVRAVDGELLPLGQALPAAIVAQNDALDVTFATLYSAFVGAASVDSFQGFS